MGKDISIGQNLGLKLNDFRKNKLFCDLFVQSKDDRILLVHKSVLATCDYFQNIVNCNVDNKLPLAETIQTDISEKQLEIVINYLYTGEVIITENINMLDLYETAYKIQLPFLQEYSTKKLERSIVLDNALQYWRHALKYNIDNLRKLCLKYIGGKTVPFFQTYSKDLTLDEFEKITENRQIFQIAESTFYRIVREWIFMDYNTRENFVESILVGKIDYKQISNSFLHNETEKFPQLKKNTSLLQNFFESSKRKQSSAQSQSRSSRSSEKHDRKSSSKMNSKSGKRKKLSHKHSTKRPKRKSIYTESYSDDSNSESGSYYSPSDYESN